MPAPIEVESARQAADRSAPLVLATDGVEFKFSVQVNTSGAAQVRGDKEIITDSSSAFFFRLLGNKVEFVMNTFNSETISAIVPISTDGLDYIIVSKENSTLCVTTTGGKKCVAAKGQMSIPGTLKWGEDEDMVKEYTQTVGSVPISFTLQGVRDDALNGMDAEVAKMELNDAIASSIARVGGYGVSPASVAIVHGPDGDKATKVLVSVNELGEQAPAVMMRLQEEKDFLEKQLRDRINAIPSLRQISSEAPPTARGRRLPAAADKVFVADLAVPAELLQCSSWACSKFTKVQPGNSCAGAACDSVCCGPMACPEVQCPAGLESVDPKLTCDDEFSCMGTCCGTTCNEEFSCPLGTCPLEANIGHRVTVANYVDYCCTSQEATCCDGASALCLACKVCMDPADFCEAVSNKTSSSERRELRGQYGSGDNGGFKLLAWWKRYWGRSKKVKEQRKAKTYAGLEDAVSNQVAVAEAQIQAILASAARRNRTTEIITALEEGAPDDTDREAGLQELRDTYFKKVSEKVPGCTPDATPACSWKLRATFTPGEQQPGGAGSVTTVKVLKAGQRAIVGNKGSANLYQFNIATGKPDIPGGRHAEGHLSSEGVLVAAGGEAGYVTASELMLDGQHGVVGYSSGKLTVFNAGDIYYPPSTSDPAGAADLMSSPINAIASMPSYKMMLLAMNNSWTLMYQYRNGGVLRFPRNVSTREETIAMRQQIIQQAFESRFSGGNNPPSKEEVKEFYSSVVEAGKLNSSYEAIAPANEAARASWNNANDYGAVKDVAYVPCSTKFATAHADGKVRYWSSMSGTQLFQMKGHKGPVNALAAHPSKEWVASGGDDGTVRVWDFEGQGKQVLLFEQKGGGPVRSLAILPGGQHLIAGSDDGVLRRYDLHTGEPVCHTLTYSGATTAMSADPVVANQLVIGTESGTAMVYR